MNFQRFLLACIPASALLFAVGCSGGGSSSSGSSSSFSLESISVQDGSVWQINRPIEFTFSTDVDFASVSLNTLSITQVGGAPAAGEFFFKPLNADGTVVAENIVVFQPACPTLDDFSDSGLQAGGIEYQVNVNGSNQGGPTVRSSGGSPLTTGQTLRFTTPISTDPTLLFVDTKIGPPVPLIRPDEASTLTAASYLQIGNDDANRVYFFERPTVDAELGGTVPASFRAPLNLYSDASTQVSVVVVVDQPVNPSATNINSERVILEYQEGLTWIVVPHDVSLAANCTQTGSLLRLTPTGILPQGRNVRVSLAPEFQDLVGETNLLPRSVATFPVGVAVDPGTSTPGDAADQIADEFVAGGNAPGSTQDTGEILDAPSATWGGGTLGAAFDFGGNGGPGGNFDWEVGGPTGPIQTFVLNTTFTVITNTQQTATQTVVNGRLDLRNLRIWPNGRLRIEGPNPCRITASGDIRIEGQIQIGGTSNRGVVTFGTTNITEVGAPGQAGGGRGGYGNLLTTQSSPKGETGYGAFNLVGAGGEGGETGYNPTTNIDARRGAGGGGGAFGQDQMLASGVCPDQGTLGLDAENGSPGGPLAGSATNPGVRPAGGDKGPRPFFDGTAQNDFWGTMLVGGNAVLGELTQPWAGAGGGGGGNSITSSSFPNTNWTAGGDEKGSGAGGGGGSLTILCLGDIIFAGTGLIDANGGTGGGGENTNNSNHVGGSSGGGSGGHVILQTSSKINFSALTFTGAGPTLDTVGGIRARGGQGGSGKDNLGGARPNGIETTIALDLLPPFSYGPGATCTVTGNTVGTGAGSDPACLCIPGAGGDGGPGIVQLHAPLLSDIIVPATAGTMNVAVRPHPYGSSPNNVQNPINWNRLLPIFGRVSKGVSKWIPLGATNVSPSSATPEDIDFLFGGLTAGGFIATSGGGTSATVTPLPPILSGVIGNQPVLPFIAADDRTVVFDATLIADDIYLRNPLLLQRFGLKIGGTEFEVGSATYESATNLLRLTVNAGGTPLSNISAGAAVDVIPRFFRVSTGGTLDALPASASIKIEFQAAPVGLDDQPLVAQATPWTSDVATINASGINPELRFVRFRVTFDIAADGSALQFSSPIPKLDFLHLPFRF